LKKQIRAGMIYTELYNNPIPPGKSRDHDGMTV